MEEGNGYSQNSNQSLDTSLAPQQKPNKKIWLWILIPILVIGIGIAVFLFINSRTDELDAKRQELLEKARTILPDEELSIFEEAIYESSSMEDLIELEESMDAYLGVLEAFDLSE